MKTTALFPILILLTAMSAPVVRGQAFSSGSDGRDGALVLSANTTLDVPPDGVFRFTTISVPSGRTLTFRPNALNTPVYLLAQGAVEVLGIIDVSGATGSALVPGQAGPGGYPGGAPGQAGIPGGDGRGPGGGRAGTSEPDETAAGPAGFGSQASIGPAARRGATYGSALLFPIVGGSGGGGAAGEPGWGGGGGGGAIVIASSTSIRLSGNVFARGGGGESPGVPNFGSGGAVRLIAPVISGVGTIDVRGNLGNNFGADGRVRIDCVDRSQLGFRFLPASSGSVGGLMAVWPDPLPRLDIFEAAGREVPLDTPTQVLLPSGSPAQQVVKVRARDFGQRVPVRVTLTPDSGPSQTVDAEIDNASANPAEVTIPVNIPANVLTHIHVWTR